MTVRSRRRLFIEFLLLALLVGVVLGRGESVLAKLTGAYDYFIPLGDIRRELVTNYVEEPNEDSMMLGAIRGMIDTLDDPYTVYFTAEQLEGFEKQTRGEFSGIGAEIDQKDNYIVIVSPLEDSPAFKAGLLAGDLIIAVDGESLEGATTTEAVKRITGPEGTEVVLTIRSVVDSKERDVTIVRKRIKIQTVKGVSRDEAGKWNYMLDDQHKVGYVRMTQFSAPTYAGMVEAMGELKKAGMKGLILDLRYNPGGLLDTAIKVADLFLDDGVIVSTKGRNRPERKWEATEAGTLDDFPMVVLINGGSASASEILSGALGDNDRAKLLGTRTVGKGSVQQIFTLEGGRGGIKLTTSYYYLPDGRNIHRREGSTTWGVDPSDGFYVRMTAEQRQQMLEIRREREIIKPENGEHDGEADKVSPEWIDQTLKDKQLAAALRAMLAKLSGDDWPVVGPGSARVLEQLALKAQLEERRGLYAERIDRIDEELGKIDKALSQRDSDAAADANTDAGDEPADANGDAVADELLEPVEAE